VQVPPRAGLVPGADSAARRPSPRPGIARRVRGHQRRAGPRRVAARVAVGAGQGSRFPQSDPLAIPQWLPAISLIAAERLVTNSHLLYSFLNLIN
jgi:hypothetical protein